MTNLELKQFESALQTRAAELQRSLAERNRITVEQSADALDATLQAVERESSAQALAEDSRLLRQVEAARGRIREGAYGVCLRCEESIAVRRLNAIPWAAFCRSCQEKAEEDEGFRPQLMRAA